MIPPEFVTATTDSAEHYAVGLSPQFWAHTPMTIHTLQNLALVNGLHCFVVGVTPCRKRFVAVSKCSLLGVIVNVDRMSNGASLLLLDDGSGCLADCVVWDNNSDDNLYSLPPLVPNGTTTTMTPFFSVGDMVQVYGKISCVSIGDVRETIVTCAMGGDGKKLVSHEIRDCIREVHVTFMQKIDPNEMRLSWNEEANHWLRSLLFQERLQNTTHIADIDDDDMSALPLHSRITTNDYDDSNNSTLLSGCIRNGAEVLALLGPDIAHQAAVLREDMPSSNDDTLGAWRVFGTSCKCRRRRGRQVDDNFDCIMDSLLYCHCQATPESLDPQFVFRDYLLQTLLTMRNNYNNSSKRGSNNNLPFCFPYKMIASDHLDILRVAHEAVAHMEKPSLNVQRLLLKTFAALRKDGIVHLLDDTTDTYMLICKECVMEPHYRTILDKHTTLEGQASSSTKYQYNNNELPTYLTNVPYQRLQYVKRCIVTAAQQPQGGGPTNIP